MHQMRSPYEEKESATTKWIVIFVVLSLLAHLVIFIAIVLLSIYVPAPKMQLPKPADNSVTLSLIQPPKPPAPPPQPKKNIFLPTPKDPNAKPDPNTIVESDNNSSAKSENKTARETNSPLPDVTGQKNHQLDLNTTPVSLTPPKPEVASTPPTPKKEEVKPEPKKEPPQKKTDEHAQPTPKPADKPAPKPATAEVVKPPPQLDPNGLPVLPPINAPTMAPPTAVDPNQQQRKASKASPPPSFQANKSDIAGSASAFGANSVAANASPLGKYKAQFYQAVGSRWYAKVAQSQSLLGVGSVRIQYTIYADGTITTKVLDDGGGSQQMLFALSLNSIREVSPFQPFSEELKKQVGTSFTDEFSFSLY